MRLIDADELLAKVNKIKYLRKLRAKMLCDECREVEAIPIEWIEKYNNENWFDTGTQYNAVTCMLDQWREEHESKDM